SGQPTTISSALGSRSGVANLARASTTTVRQPSSFAAAQSDSAVSIAPNASTRGGGPYTSANARPPSSRSSTRLLPPCSPAASSASAASPSTSPPPRTSVSAP